MLRRGAEQEAVIRANVVTIDDCDRAQGWRRCREARVR